MKLNELKCVCDNIDIDEYIEFMDSVKKNYGTSRMVGNFY